MTSRQIMTVTGPVSGEDLGKVYMHEHFGWGFPGWEIFSQLERFRFDRQRFIDEAVKFMTELKALGVKTVVEATPSDSGRDPLMYREIAECAEMNIICLSAFFKESMGGVAHIKFRMGSGSAEEELYELFCHELQYGIGDTGVKPGLLKIATDTTPISACEMTLIRAVARAAKDNDVSVITHVDSGQHGPEQARLLLELGMDPKRVMIGHLNNVTDYMELAKIYRQGVYGGFDRWGLIESCPTWFSGPEEDQYAVLCSVLGAGFGKQVLFSHDCDLWLRGFSTPGEIHNPWLHIPEVVLPALRARGITQEQIDDIMINNPREFLCGN